MNCAMHYNLIKESERLSSSPIRLRIMLPLFCLLAVAALIIWWLLLGIRQHLAQQQRGELETVIAARKPALTQIAQLRADEREAHGALAQLTFYRNARLCFGEILARLPESVPARIQLTELNIPLPPGTTQPARTKGQEPPAFPTNTVEKVTLKLAGRASGDNPGDTIAELLQALRSSSYSHFIQDASIPKNAFRQDSSRAGAEAQLLFEITCNCNERRFE